LHRFAKEIKPKFSQEEIKFIIESDFEAKNMDEIEYIHRYLVALYKDRLDKNSIVFDIYDKLTAMNIIEKYILYKRVYNFRAEKKKVTTKTIQDYFEEFIV